MKIYLITNYNNIMPQKLHETVGLDIVKLQKLFFQSGFFTDCIIINIDDFTNNILMKSVNVNNDYFYFCSSQIDDYKEAIKDIAYETENNGGILCPNLSAYFSHENKFYQELMKNRLNIKTPSSILLTTSNSTLKYKDIKLPIVAKASSGFGSLGVKLIKSNDKLVSITNSLMNKYIYQSLDFSSILKNLIKSKIKYKNLYPNSFGRVIYQELIPDLSFDWKVLVFGSKVYALKRYTRDNDFRASGSGKFDYNEIADDELIKFAVETRKKLNLPFVSLDIADNGGKEYSIIEYQGVHFGLATVINAINEYVYDIDVEVNKSNTQVDIEKLFYESYMEFIEKNE